ncbi:protein of unknown function [Methylocella tundrae]|uniref:Uncharacterized protein n=1 Tax=Methylocella tundrae TaxID=227605 RepID=A0A4U8Z1Q0_METTU|nr:protein of unknown function [Methylocella tundrae]
MPMTRMIEFFSKIAWRSHNEGLGAGLGWVEDTMLISYSAGARLGCGDGLDSGTA